MLPFTVEWWKTRQDRVLPHRQFESCTPVSLNRPKWEIRYSRSMDEVTSNTGVLVSEVPALRRPALRICGLRKAFGDVRAVDGIDLEVASGECFGLLGPNGAGKTTTIEICEGLTAPDEGTVELLGLNWRTRRRGAAAADRDSTAGDAVSRQADGGRDAAAVQKLLSARDFGGGVDSHGAA